MCRTKYGDMVEFSDGFTERLGVVDLVHESVGLGGVNYLTIHTFGTGMFFLRRENEVTPIFSEKDQTIADLEKQVSSAEARIKELEQIRQSVTVQRDKANEEASFWEAETENWRICYRSACAGESNARTDAYFADQRVDDLQDLIYRLRIHFGLDNHLDWDAEDVVDQIIAAGVPRPGRRRFQDRDGDVWIETSPDHFRMNSECCGCEGLTLNRLHMVFGPLKDL